MVAINFLNYMDRYVGAAIVTPIKTEFQLNDAQIGLLATAFLLVYAIAALPFGYWGDRTVRKTVIGVGVTIWSLATLFSGLAANYVHLFLSRAAVGIGEASYYPAGTSLVSDYFPKEQRGRVMSIWGTGSVTGIAAAYAGGGLVAAHYGWRTALLIGAVCITIALIAPLNVGPVPVFVPAFLITVIALYLQSGPFTAVSQNVVSPALRASSVTLLLFVSHVFGDSHSTFDVGWISDQLHNLQLALLITSPTLLVVAAIIASTGLRTVKPDTETMEAEWAGRAAEPAASTV